MDDSSDFSNDTRDETSRLIFIVRMLIWTPLLALICVPAAQAQERQRSPWRASFTEVNPDAVKAQEQNASNPQADWKPSNALGDQRAGSNTADSSRSVADTNPQIRSPAAQSQPETSSQQTLAGSQVTRSMDRLPNDAGQVWREYDISPYTSKIQSVNNPQQAILDWVLRETGNEMWFNEPLGILHATPSRLIVYHTPEIQTAVKNIVDRFVHTRGQLQSFNVNLVTIGNPNWRAAAYPLLQTINVKSPSVEAWLVTKENAAILFNQLKNRPDFKEQSGGAVNTHDGQSFTFEKTKPVPFVRSLRWTPGQFPGYEPLLTTINEGYKVSMSPLTTLDNQSVEICIRADVDQVETLEPVRVPVGGANNTVQQVDLNVPRVVSWRLHERFRWPSDQVLVISSGVVADPQPEAGAGIGTLRSLGLGVARQNNGRSDALLMVEYRGPSTGASLPRSAGRSHLQPLNKR